MFKIVVAPYNAFFTSFHVEPIEKFVFCAVLVFTLFLCIFIQSNAKLNCLFLWGKKNFYLSLLNDLHFCVEIERWHSLDEASVFRCCLFQTKVIKGENASLMRWNYYFSFFFLVQSIVLEFIIRSLSLTLHLIQNRVQLHLFKALFFISLLILHYDCM